MTERRGEFENKRERGTDTVRETDYLVAVATFYKHQSSRCLGASSAKLQKHTFSHLQIVLVFFGQALRYPPL